ncbi:Pvc16 family protein [Streptomyces chartreusis]|uniref:Pvc16 family protein n=1 Tax=Streptomyces chartreusis TaxID=1969 RepID=UPI0034002A07
MMDAVTSSLGAWLTHTLPSETTITFDLPDNGTHAGVASDAQVSAYLYDVREEPHRNSGVLSVRDDRAQLTGRQDPPRVFQFSYILTAQGRNALARQHLLGAVLQAGGCRHALPAEFVATSLVERGIRSMALAVAPHDALAATHLWAASLLPPGPALSIALLAPLVPDIDYALAPAPREVSLGIGNSDLPDAGITRRSRSGGRGRIEETPTAMRGFMAG